MLLNRGHSKVDRIRWRIFIENEKRVRKPEFFNPKIKIILLVFQNCTKSEFWLRIKKLWANWDFLILSNGAPHRVRIVKKNMIKTTTPKKSDSEQWASYNTTDCTLDDFILFIRKKKKIWMISIYAYLAL